MVAPVFRLNDQVEQYTIQVEQCRNQTAAMEKATGETVEHLAKAEAELKAVQVLCFRNGPDICVGSFISGFTSV